MLMLIWGVIIFLVFMTGIFILKKSYVLATLLAPLLASTMFWAWHTHKTFRPLSKYVSLSSVFEVQRGEDSEDVQRLRIGHPVSWSQSNLNRRRYAQNDETLYVAPEDDRTDYSQPPMANWYRGVLNTGKRRYGHPALNGLLPLPWLPATKGHSLGGSDTNAAPKTAANIQPAVVVTLRKRYSSLKQDAQSLFTAGAASTSANGAGEQAQAEQHEQPMEDTIVNPWRESPRPRLSQSEHLTHRLSFDYGSGVIALPEGEGWLPDDESDSDDELPDARQSAAHSGPEDTDGPGLASPKRYNTYYHHPERRRQTLPRS